MAAPSTSSSSIIFQEVVQHIHSRKLMLQSPTTTAPSPSEIDSLEISDQNSFDENVVMILSVLLTAVICSFILNSIIRCVMRWSSIVSTDSEDNRTTKLTDIGIPKNALEVFPKIEYTHELKSPGLATECVICLSEFATGESVRVLPKCQHGFHVGCIDKWLSSHSSCPICRQCLVETCQKIVSFKGASISVPMPPSLEEC